MSKNVVDYVNNSFLSHSGKTLGFVPDISFQYNSEYMADYMKYVFPAIDFCIKNDF